METKELLDYFLKNGVLVDKDVLSIVSEGTDFESVKLIIERIKSETNTKVITKKLFDQNKAQVSQALSRIPNFNENQLEKLKIKLGLSIEISKEVTREVAGVKNVSLNEGSVKVVSKSPLPGKKFEVGDFTKYFQGRFNEMKNILQQHSELSDLVSISKLSGNRQNVSILGIVYEKRVTKNKNMILDVEDNTGRIKVLISASKPELFEKAREIPLDGVVGFKGSGSREIMFANDVVFPDSMLQERKRSIYDESAIFLADLHFGSKRFLEKSFMKFLDYLNGKVPNTPEVDKIKYVFLIGDIITGVGNYPNQERDLRVVDLEDQFLKLADLLRTIRKDIKIIISPGNHDGVRLMEPQPFLDEKFAWPLYDLENVVITPNPAVVNIGAKPGFGGFNVLTYHGFSFPHYANEVPSLLSIRAMNAPENIMAYLLKHRHLAPTHASTQYFPAAEDGLLIKEVPDIFVAGHTHKSGVLYYNNVLCISSSCWEAMTPYQEKFGNEPDHCKVPMFNLKTGQIKILDFEVEENGDS